MTDVVVALRGVSKDYRGLRPLRIEDLTVRRGESVALVGLDAIASEVLVNLITGATVPDQGEVLVFGQPTTAVNDGDAWLASLDRFGILSERAVLLDQMTTRQNLAVPFSLELARIPDAVQGQVDALANEVGLSPDERDRALAELEPERQLRVRLGRALALSPEIILAEHPNAAVQGGAATTFAQDFKRIVARRGCAAITITGDRIFALAITDEVFMHEPASGTLRARAGWRKWF